MISLLEEMVKILQSSEGENLYPEFEDELNTLVKTSGDTGYGFKDEVKSLISELKVVMGKD